MNYYMILDPRSLNHIKAKGDLNIPFSHDLNIIEYSKFLVANGKRVYWSSLMNPSESILYIEGTMENRVNSKTKLKLIPTVQAIVSSDAVNMPDKSSHPAALRIYFQAAVFVAEQPGETNPMDSFALAHALRTKVDFVVTQNLRMRQMLFVLYSVIAGWKSDDRILLAPLGPNELIFEDQDYSDKRRELRQKYGIAHDAVVILNAGGYWRWTDANTFLEGFIQCIKEDPRLDIYFIQPSFSQGTNSDHDEYVVKAKRMIAQLPPQLQRKIIVAGDWHEGALALPDFLRISDVGLNVNNGGLENWLSHRVRVTNYLSAGMAVLSTGGDELEDWGQNILFRVSRGDVENYKSTIKGFVENALDLENKRFSSQKLGRDRLNGNQYKELQHHLEKAIAPLDLTDYSMLDASKVMNLVSTTSISKRVRISLNKIKVIFLSNHPRLHLFLVKIGFRSLYRKLVKWRI
jgi:hypothetical protein